METNKQNWFWQRQSLNGDCSKGWECFALALSGGCQLHAGKRNQSVELGLACDLSLVFGQWKIGLTRPSEGLPDLNMHEFSGLWREAWTSVTAAKCLCGRLGLAWTIWVFWVCEFSFQESRPLLSEVLERCFWTYLDTNRPKTLTSFGICNPKKRAVAEKLH